MKILVVGATGATGSLVVKDALRRGFMVTALVRSKEKLIKIVGANQNLRILEGTVLDLEETKLNEIVKEAEGIISCLGHNLTFKGIYGKPRKLVTDSLKKLTKAVMQNSPQKPVKIVLMNTTGNRNRDIYEKRSIFESIVISLIRLLLPPQSDNEKAAEHLRVNINRNGKCLEWVAVRPDGLVDHEKVSEYEIYPSPIRSPIFNAGSTSRINVGYFINELLEKDKLWEKYKYTMPVIYNT